MQSKEDLRFFEKERKVTISEWVDAVLVPQIRNNELPPLEPWMLPDWWHNEEIRDCIKKQLARPEPEKKKRKKLKGKKNDNNV